MSEDNNLTQRIDALLRAHPKDVEQIEQSAKAFQRRLDTVFDDLGLKELAPTVRVLPDAGYEVVVEFPTLGRRWADRILRRLEDIERGNIAHVSSQINQESALF